MPLAAPELSAIVLCYRAEESTRLVIEPLDALLREAGITHEIVLVANYWPDRPDRTPDVARELDAELPSVRTVILPKEGGMGWDMRTGLRAATGEYLVVIDGDAQNPVEDVLEAYKRLKQTGADVVKGRRVARYDGAYRKLVSFVYNIVFTTLFPSSRGLWDINGKPKGLTRNAYERMELRYDNWFLDADLMLNALRRNMTIVEFPVVFYRNAERPSFVRPQAIIEFVVNLTRERLQGARSR